MTESQLIGAVPDLSPWDIFIKDPWFLWPNLFVVAIVVALVLVVRRRYVRFFKLQREALDHRKSADAKALAQNQSVEQLIAQQYGLINAYNQQVATRAEEALRISNETLAQISSMNQSIARIAERLDRAAGGTT